MKKYYQKTIEERQQALADANLIELAAFKEKLAPEVANNMIENYLTNYEIPQGLALNYVVNQQEYLVPMVTEEPSVIAASSNGAKIVKQAGGFKAHIEERLMIGQIIIENIKDLPDLMNALAAAEQELVQVANDAHPSMLKRGGGAKKIRLRPLTADLLSLDLFVDVQEALGANMLNTMLEAVANMLEDKYLTGQSEVVMSILSNYATSCLVSASCAIPVANLGQEVAEKIAKASEIAQLDVYRATTHNKGVMNGIDAVVIALGNDWRAIESGVHAYAARDGKYKGISTWKVIGDQLVGKIMLPLPIATVGGSIKIVPLVKTNQQIMQVQSAKELAQVIAAVGLGQNLAALKALVTEGIQKGHMQLHLKSLAVQIGASEAEVPKVVQQLQALKKRDLATAQAILKELRQ